MAEDVQYKKYGQYLKGQFRKTSKKPQALFIGRSVQILTESMEQHKKELMLKMDTLRFIVKSEPLLNDDGAEVPGWIRLIVACAVGSYMPYTEEDRKADEVKRKAREEARRRSEEETGMAAMEAMERQVCIPPAEAEIQ